MKINNIDKVNKRSRYSHKYYYIMNMIARECYLCKSCGKSCDHCNQIKNSDFVPVFKIKNITKRKASI